MRPEQLRHVNRKRVLDALRSRSPQSRVGLSEHLGLTRSTLTVIVSALIEEGLVRDADVDASRPRTGGRPRVGLELVDDGAFFAGVTVDKDGASAIVVNLLGEEVTRGSATVSAESIQPAEQAAVALLRGAVNAHPQAAERLCGIGVTVPGVVIGDILKPVPKHGRSHEVQLGRELAAAFDVPVFVENDANACAINESLLAAGSPSRDVLFILLDAGVGAGMLTNGQVTRGFAGRAGEVGHIRLPVPQGAVDTDPGPKVEALIGVGGVLAKMRARTGHAADFTSYLTMLAAGQPDAVVVAEEWQHLLGWLTATLTRVVAPDAVVFGGPLVALLEPDRATFERSLRAHGISWELPIEISRYGADAVAMGAAALPRADFFSLPILRPEHATT